MVCPSIIGKQFYSTFIQCCGFNFYRKLCWQECFCSSGLKQFVAYLYSDEACKLFAESGAIQPVLGIADSLEGDNKMFYSIYDNGAKAAMGNFASFSAIPGVEVRTVFFDPVNSLVSGSMTEQQWIDGIKSASDQMRANIIE